MSNATRPFRSFVFLAAALLAFAVAGNVHAEDLSGTWTVTGRHPSEGAYRGTAALTAQPGAPGKYAIEWNVTFTDSGAGAGWSGTGSLVGKTLRTTFALGGSGVVDRLGGAWEGATEVKGVYRLRSQGRSLNGRWTATGEGPTVRGYETMRRTTGLRIDRVEPAVLNRQPGAVTVRVLGSGFPAGLRAEEIRIIDPEIATEQVVAVAADGTSAEIRVAVSSSVSLGDKTVAVKDVKKEKALSILELDLRTDSDRNGTVDAADDRVEEAAPGAVALVAADATAEFLPVRLQGYVAPGLSGTLVLAWEGSGAVRVLDSEQRDIVNDRALEGRLPLSAAAPNAPALRLAGIRGGSGFLTVRYEGDGFRLEDRVRVQIVEEQAYYFLWAYLGKEHTYLDGELRRIQTVFDALKRQGFVVYDDGKSFDQSILNKAHERAEVLKNPKRIVVDRNTTRADWEKYMARRSVRGIFWAGHGFMEPFLGCPDSELLMPESRVWSAAPGDPASNEKRCFVREWMERVKTQTVLPLDFAIMHSCATGGFGKDYGDEPWEYANPETKARVMAKYGRYPPLSELTEVTFNRLQPHVKYLVTYSGSAYFGLWDVDMNQVIRSISASR